MVDDVRLVTLASLVEAGAGARELHGIARADDIVPAGHYERRRAACVDTTHLLPRENVFHEYINSLGQSFGPIRRCVLHDALVTDQGAVITRSGALVEESCWEFLAHKHVPHGLVREDAGRFRTAAGPSRRVSAPSLLVKRPWWRNYGHWLVDAAALIALLVKHRTGGFEQLVVGAAQDPKLRAIMRETLTLVAPDMPVIEHPDTEMWAFSELHYVTPVRRSPMCTIPEAIEALRVAVLGAGRVTRGERRLLISRRNYGRRRLANEAAVMEVCARHGFEVVYPEQWSLREQAALFRSACAVVGVKGAALANLIFSPRDAVVVSLSPADFADPFFWDIAAARDMPYCEIFGSLTTKVYAQAQNPFTIDTDRLDGVLRAVLGPAAATAGQNVPTAFTAAPPIIAPENKMTEGHTAPVPELNGASYLACLADIHARTKPRSYLEIGTLNGKTLALSRSRSIAVDPAFLITETIPGAMPSLFLFQGTSDDFFRAYDPRVLLGGPVDLVFLDGMHLFEFVLRDFINTERFCHHGSMIILHDCIPPELGMTGRDMEQVRARQNARYPGWWTGDVWKTVDILMRHRPDLDIVALDAPPTGLVVLRKLDPTSSVLQERYDAIVDEVRRRPDLPAFSDYMRKLPLYGTSIIDWFDAIDPGANRHH